MPDSFDVGPLPNVPTDILIQSGRTLRSQIRTAQDSSGERRNEELKVAAQEFESLFVAYLLKVMRETIEESGLMESGLGKSIYTDLFDQEISRNIAKHGAFGIADLVFEKLSANNLDAGLQKSFYPDDQISPAQESIPAIPQSEESYPNFGSDIPDFLLPVQAPISSDFGLRQDPFLRQLKFHKGVDLAAPAGTKVRAALGGTVVFAGYEKGYGNNVLIQHSGGLQTRYAHLRSLNVRPGDVISTLEELGVVGDTGRSTGPHLHFEVIRQGETIDPRAVLISPNRINDSL